MKAHAYAKALIDKELKRQRDGCTTRLEERHARIDEDYRKLQTLCDTGDFGAAKVASGYACVLGGWHATVGSFTLNAQQDPEGWKPFDLGARYAYWEVKLVLGARLRALQTGEYAKTLSTEVDVLASLLCYSYVLNLTEQFAKLRRMWGLVTSIPGLTMREDQEGRVSKWRNVKPDGFVYSYGHFDRFICRLFGGPRFGVPFQLYDEMKRLTLGDYEDIVSAWRDQGELIGAALVRVADFHTRNIESTSNWSLHLPFNHSISSLSPWEIAAIYKLRTTARLQTPKIEHPLMSLPAASLAPRKATPINDPIFDQLEELYNNNCRIEDYL